MQALQADTMEDRAGTLHSGLLPQPMAAEAVAVGPVLLLLAQAVLVAASGQKVLRAVLWERTARAQGVVVLPQQA